MERVRIRHIVAHEKSVIIHDEFVTHVRVADIFDVEGDGAFVIVGVYYLQGFLVLIDHCGHMIFNKSRLINKPIS